MKKTERKHKNKLAPVAYPKIGELYGHYKGGVYDVLTLAKHSESDNIKQIFEKLDSIKINLQAKKLIDELKKCFDENLVIYKSVGFGSVHARPLSMWYDIIPHENDDYDEVRRFKLLD